MNEIFKRNVPGTTEILQTKTIGIAGCGGLGSNVAFSLTRAGIGSLVLVDFDKVELSNINRQAYFLKDVGILKVEVLEDYLLQINPVLQIKKVAKKISREDVFEIFSDVDLLVEAFDRAEEKQWLIETWCERYSDKPIVVGSGIGGIGKTDHIKIHKAGNVIVCGDETSSADIGLCSSRVAIVAHMQANEAISWLVENT